MLFNQNILQALQLKNKLPQLITGIRYSQTLPVLTATRHICIIPVSGTDTFTMLYAISIFKLLPFITDKGENGSIWQTIRNDCIEHSCIYEWKWRLCTEHSCQQKNIKHSVPVVACLSVQFWCRNNINLSKESGSGDAWQMKYKYKMLSLYRI